MSTAVIRAWVMPLSLLASVPLLAACQARGNARSGTAGASGGDAAAGGDGFVHPGIMHTRADLERMKTRVMEKAYPWYGAFHGFQIDARSSPRYVAAPIESVTTGYPRVRADAHAAYQNAVMWSITSDVAHASAALGILSAWAETCRSWICSNNIDAYTSALHFAAAAEILRHGEGSGWTAAHTDRVTSFFAQVMWPVLEGTFLGTGQNGCSATPGDGNQGAGDIRGMMALAIFLDDRAKFEQATQAFMATEGAPNRCVAIAKEAGGYVDINGCPGEAGRDQPHAQGGLASYCEMAQMAWSQGLDLWSHASDRILLGLEWLAKYNLGHDDVPFSNSRSCYSSYGGLSAVGRGQWTMTYEMAYNHYANVMGRAMPHTKHLLDSRLRPEGSATDDPGFGTLLFSLQADATAPLWGGTYKIVSLASGKALGTVGPSIGQGTKLEQSTWTNRTQQHFTLTPLGGEYYRISSGAPSSATLVVDAGSAPSAAGVAVHLWNADSSDNKMWKIVSAPGGGGVRFVARDTILMKLPITQLAWDLADGALADGVSLQMNVANAAAETQLFTLSDTATPPNPAGLTATVSAGRVTLGWSAAPTATSYRVKRAQISGGPYTLVGEPGLSTSFTDSRLLEGTPAYYVVTAVNSAGEGPASRQLPVQP